MGFGGRRRTITELVFKPQEDFLGGFFLKQVGSAGGILSCSVK